MSKIELPIFSDNLKSSGSWSNLLASERQTWSEALAPSDSRERIERRLLPHQFEQARARADRELNEQRYLRAVSAISAWSREPEAKLSAERLLELHRILIGAPPAEDVLRKSEPLPINSMHDPTPARLLPRMIDNAFDWFTTQGFSELHAVEQAAVVYLRLLDLHPFTSLNETTALLAAGFYTERAGFPQLVIPADEAALARYTGAIEAAFRMLTQPLVEFFSEMLRRTMRFGLGGEDEG